MRYSTRSFCTVGAISLSVLVLCFLVPWMRTPPTPEVMILYDNAGTGLDQTGLRYFVTKRNDDNTFELIERYTYYPTRDFLDGVIIKKRKTRDATGAFPYQPDVPVDPISHRPWGLFTDVFLPVNTTVVLFYTGSENILRAADSPDGTIKLDTWSSYEFVLQQKNVISSKMLHENAKATLGKYAGKVAK